MTRDETTQQDVLTSIVHIHLYLLNNINTILTILIFLGYVYCFSHLAIFVYVNYIELMGYCRHNSLSQSVLSCATFYSSRAELFRSIDWLNEN